METCLAKTCVYCPFPILDKQQGATGLNLGSQWWAGNPQHWAMPGSSCPETTDLCSVRLDLVLGGVLWQQLIKLHPHIHHLWLFTAGLNFDSSSVAQSL